MTTATTLRKYQDIIEGKLPPGLQAHIDAKSESKEEEVEESTEEEVEESTEEEVEESRHFSLSQVNNAPILRKYQDILKEVSTSDLHDLEKETRDADSFDAAYAKMFGDETDDPNSGMLDTFWRSDEEVLRDKKRRYAAELRRRGMSDFGDITTNPQVLQKNKDDKLRDRLAKAGYNQDPNKRPSTTKTMASTGIDKTLTPYMPGSKQGGDYKAPTSMPDGPEVPMHSEPTPDSPTVPTSMPDGPEVPMHSEPTLDRPPAAKQEPAQTASKPALEFNPHDGVVGFPLNSDSRYSYTKPEPKVVTSPELKPKPLPQKHRETRPRMLGQ
jgi:hypothetical protein